MRQKLRENLQLIIALAAVFSLAFGAVAYFAKASDLDQVAMRLEQKIKADQIYYLQQRLWQLYDRYKTEDCNKMPQPACGECRSIKAKLEALKGR